MQYHIVFLLDFGTIPTVQCFSVRFWNYSDSAVYIVFLLDFGTIPTVQYHIVFLLDFGNIPAVQYHIVFLLDFGTIPTVQYHIVFLLVIWNYSDSAVSYCFSVILELFRQCSIILFFC